MHDGIQGNVATIDTHKGHARAIRAKLRFKCSLTLRKRGQALSVACEIQTPIEGNQQDEPIGGAGKLVTGHARPARPAALAPQLLVKRE